MAQNNQTSNKKIPQRRCVGCGEHFSKSELVRVLRTPEGEVILDLSGKKSGRGAYICQNETCFKKARKANRFASALEVAVSDEVLNALEEEVRLFEKERADV